jgi:hypothetical protein
MTDAQTDVYNESTVDRDTVNRVRQDVPPEKRVIDRQANRVGKQAFKLPGFRQLVRFPIKEI